MPYERKKIKKLLMLHAVILGCVLGWFVAQRAINYFIGYYASKNTLLELLFLALVAILPVALILAVVLAVFYFVSIRMLGLKYVPLSLVCFLLTAIALVGSSFLLRPLTILNGYYHNAATNADINTIYTWMADYEPHANDREFSRSDQFILHANNLPKSVKAMNPSRVVFGIDDEKKYVRIIYRLGRDLIFGLCVYESSVPQLPTEERRQFSKNTFIWISEH